MEFPPATQDRYSVVKYEAKNGHRLNLVVADDNPSDLLLLRLAAKRNGQNVRIHELRDGSEVIDYLQGHGPFADRQTYPMPDLLLLDLKMQELSGFDVLLWLRSHPQCSRIPTVVLSGSGLEKDVERAYALGANTYFEKPSSFTDFMNLVQLLIHYWVHSKRPLHPNSC